MKRELAALESVSLLIDGKTRSRNSNTVSVSPRLVYKRVKRSVTTKETYGSNQGVKGERKESTCGEVAEVEGKDVTEKLLEGEVEECNGTNERSPRRLTRSTLVSNVKNQENVTCGEVAEVEVKDVNEKLLEGEVKECNGTIERNSRRFTRSALASNVENEENAELKSSKRLTRSTLKLEMEMEMEMIDSSLIEVSDCVVKDEENTEHGICVENVKGGMDKDVMGEAIISTPKRRMEMKMSKKILLAKTPTTVKELFETGLLEGCPVYYNGAKRLEGRIRALGILCSCDLCQGQKVVPISVFEIHACNIYKRAIQYICLENGRSFIDILKNCKSVRKSTLEETVLNAIGPLPERKLVVCRNCKEPFYTMDANNPDPVCSPCIMSNESSIGPVFAAQKMWSFKSVRLMKPQSASPSSVVHPDRSLANLNEKSSQAVCPMRPSPVASDGMPQRNSKKSNGKSAKASHTVGLRSSPRFAKSSATKIIAKIEEVVPMISKSSNNLSMGKSSNGKDCEELMNSLETCSSPTRQLSGTKASENLIKKSFKTALSPNSSGLLATGKSSFASVCEKTTQRLKKEVSVLKPLKSPPVGSSSGNKASGKITRKDLRLHKLVFEDDILPDGTELGYYVRGKKLLDGYKKGAGIFCNCCENVISASQFEAHAGCAARRKPYCYIYTSNGVSLHELSLNLIQSRTHSAKFNDDLCTICADGGDLLLCDGCPRAFHIECTSLSSVPVGKWYCEYCQNLFEKEKLAAQSVNAIAAGRIAGVDPIEQITTRSIRIVDTMATELSACILCRCYDFCKAGFGPRTIILCDQCEKEYHIGCLKDHNIADLTELPEGKWFCSSDCGRIDSDIQTVMDHGDEKLPNSLVDIILKKHVEKSSAFTTDPDVRWRLLSGKTASSETSPLLNQAIAIFHESFAPIIDAKSSQDLIRAMVYGKNVAGQEYGGMYCGVLTVDSVVVSAGIFRVFGSEIAEIPLVATSTDNQGKGYFQALFTCIEKLLAFLKVKSLVLPAAEEAKSIWTDHFGFTNMHQDEIQEIRRNYWSIVRFQGTSMLHKPVPECCITQNPETEQ